MQPLSQDVLFTRVGSPLERWRATVDRVPADRAWHAVAIVPEIEVLGRRAARDRLARATFGRSG